MVSSPIASDINTLISGVIEGIKTGKTVLFLGAGISRNSGIPMVAQLVPYILQKLDVTKEETELVMNSDLPFEVFMEILHESSNIDRLLDVFEGGQPNAMHILIARLVKAEHLKTIVSTNFDTLIEKALEAEGLKRGEDFEVTYKEEEFDAINWNDDKIRLIKIHGSIKDKANIGVTLKKVASEQLSQQRQGVINHIFSEGAHNNVLVLGYSSSDEFDLTPHIRIIKENRKNVIYIQHNSKREAVEGIADQRKKNPFTEYGGHRIFYHTDKLGKVAQRQLLQEEYEVRKHMRAWQKDVDAWVQQMEEVFIETVKYLIAISIFYRISEFEISKKYSEQALNVARSLDHKLGEGAALLLLGNAYKGLGDYPNAIESYEQALNIIRAFEEKQAEIILLTDLGVVYDILGNYPKAIEFHKESQELAIAFENKQGEENALNHLGTAYYHFGKYRRAIESHEKALELAIALIDKTGEGNALNNLGIAYKELGDYPKAIEYHKKSLELAIALVDRQGEGSALNNLGIAYKKLGNYPKAIEYHERALKIKKAFGDKIGEGYAFAGLGVAYFSLGKYSKAIEFYKKALQVYRVILPDNHPHIKEMVVDLKVAEKVLDIKRNGIFSFSSISAVGWIFFRKIILGVFKRFIKIVFPLVLYRLFYKGHPQIKSVEGNPEFK